MFIPLRGHQALQAGSAGSLHNRVCQTKENGPKAQQALASFRQAISALAASAPLLPTFPPLR